MNLEWISQSTNILAVRIEWLMIIGGIIYGGIVLVKKAWRYLHKPRCPRLGCWSIGNICKVLIFLCIICITILVVTALLLDLYEFSSEEALIISGRIISWGVIVIFGVRWYWCRLVDKLKTWLNQEVNLRRFPNDEELTEKYCGIYKNLERYSNFDC